MASAGRVILEEGTVRATGHLPIAPTGRYVCPMTEPSGAPRPIDTLLTGATVLTIDAEDTVVANAAVAIDAGVIVAVGPTAALLAAHHPRETVVADGCFVLPGLINAHAHLAMTMFRGYADELDLQGFLDRMLPVETQILARDTVTTGVRLALAESLLAGITTTLDMFFHPEAAVAVAADVGFRLHAGPVFVTFPGPDRREFAERMTWAADLLAKGAIGVGGQRWVMPHGTYTLSPDQLRAVGELAQAFHCRMTIHAAENPAEVDMVVAATGRRPVELLADLGLLDERAVLAHGVELTDREIALVAATGATVAHCPLSNLKLASGFCRVPDLIDAGAKVALGTDGTASSNDLDLWMAMRFAATIHKARAKDATVLPAARVLRMATIDGARALGIAEQVGSIEVGKRADLVIVDGNRAHLVPSYDAASTLVYAAGRGDVRDVFVDGRRVVRNGECTTIDVTAAVAAMRALGERIAAL